MDHSIISAPFQAPIKSKRRTCLGCLGRLAIAGLALLVVVLIAGTIYQSVASANDLKRYPPPGKLYQVGDIQMHLYCTGEGSPTVILEAGAASPSLTWFLVQAEVAKFTRVCSYDRAGIGWSDPASEPLSSDQVAEDLHQLLQAASVPGPYILAGHSLGGIFVRSFTRQYPSEVAGLVLVDSSHESQNQRFPAGYTAYSQKQNMTYSLCQALSPFGLVRLARLWNMMIPKSIAETPEGQAAMSTMYRSTFCKAAYNEILAHSESQAVSPASLGDLPLVVLTATATWEAIPEAVIQGMGGQAVFDQLIQVGRGLQLELVGLSTRGRQVMADKSGHYIMWDQPELVIDAIRALVEEAR